MDSPNDGGRGHIRERGNRDEIYYNNTPQLEMESTDEFRERDWNRNGNVQRGRDKDRDFGRPYRSRYSVSTSTEIPREIMDNCTSDNSTLWDQVWD